MVRRLRMAGYRGKGPVVTFIAVRVITPCLLFAVATFYIFVVLQFQYPFGVKLGIAIAAALLGYYAPAIYVRNRIAKRQKSIRRAWPDALDLLLICVESGMGVESAFRKVAEEIGSQSIELAEELSQTTAELSYLPERRKAYENLGERTGLDGVKAVVTTLVQAEKYGTPRRPIVARPCAGKPGHADGRGGEEGSGTTAQAHRSDDRIFPAGSVRGPHHTGGDPGFGGTVEMTDSIQKARVRADFSEALPFRRLLGDTAGIAALEFALISPVMLAILLGMFSFPLVSP